MTQTNDTTALTCIDCGRPISKKARRCRTCQGRNLRERVATICSVCGKVFGRVPSRIERNDANYCSMTCRNEGYRKERRFDNHGYVVVFHEGRRVKEHRLVMERVLGRPLLASEVVHHRNRDITDNRPENLSVMTRSEHNRLHRAEDGPIVATKKRTH